MLGDRWIEIVSLMALIVFGVGLISALFALSWIYVDDPSRTLL